MGKRNSKRILRESNNKYNIIIQTFFCHIHFLIMQKNHLSCLLIKIKIMTLTDSILRIFLVILILNFLINFTIIPICKYLQILTLLKTLANVFIIFLYVILEFVFIKFKSVSDLFALLK